MLRKTLEFDKAFTRDKELLRIGYVAYEAGSYKTKEFGEYISDIDINEKVNIDNPNFLHFVNRMLQKIKGSNIKFLYTHCGYYNDFRLPWKITEYGDCIYDREEVKKWLSSIKGKIDLKMYKKIKNTLGLDKEARSITIFDLFTVREMLKKLGSRIKWYEEDLKKGEKTIGGITYNFIDLLRQSENCVFNYLYKYENTYTLIEQVIIDKKYRVKRPTLYEWYKRNLYKYYKFLKWFYDIPNLEELQKKITPYSVLASKIKLLEILKSDSVAYNSMKPRIEKECLTTGLTCDETTFDAIHEKINKILTDNLFNYLKPNFETDTKIVAFYLRQLESVEPTSQEFINKTKTPFYVLSDKEIVEVIEKAKKHKIDYVKFVNCIYDTSVKYKVKPSSVLSLIN